MSDSFIGRHLGKFEVLEKLGQGGMGKVYKGRQVSLNRLVAIKVLPAQLALDEEFVHRFQQEARLIANLQHEHIVHVYDVESIRLSSGDPLWFIVMELVDGYNLRQRPGGDRPMAAADVRSIGHALCLALDYAHERGVIHRDIKSANVMITREGKIKLMDFGVAKSAGGVKTATGSILGTPDYMAPEQARSAEVTPRSDIYSLGILLYELSTGRLPFSGGDPFQVAFRHISEEPTPPRQLVPTLPAALEAIILRALRKDPAERYASAADMARDLFELAGGAEQDATILTPPSAATLVPPSPSPLAGPPSPASPSTPTVPSAVRDQAPTLPAPPPPDPPPPVAPRAVPPETVPAGAVRPGGTRIEDSASTTADAAPGPKRAVWILAALLLFAAAAAGGFLWRGQLDSGRAEPGQVDGAQGPALGGDGVGAGSVGGPEAGPNGNGPNGGDAPVLDDGVRQSALEEARRLLEAARYDDALANLPAEPAAGEDPEVAELRRQIEVRRTEEQPPEPSDLPRSGRDAPSGPGADAGGSAVPSAGPRTEAAAAVPVTSEPAASEPAASEPAGKAGDAGAESAPDPTQSASQLWIRAQLEKDDERYHSLRQTLEILERVDPDYARSARWRSKVDGWVRDRESEIREALEDRLDDLVEAIEDEELEDFEDLWAGRLDRASRDRVRDWWDRYRKLAVDYRIESTTFEDHRARFVVVLDVRGRVERRGDFEPVTRIRWSGRLEELDGSRFLDPLR